MPIGRKFRGKNNPLDIENSIIYKGSKINEDMLGNSIKVYRDEDIMKYFEDIKPSQSVSNLREIDVVIKEMKNSRQRFDNIIFKYCMG